MRRDAWTAMVLAAGLMSSSAWADFDPSGRSSRPPPRPTGPSPRRPAPRPSGPKKPDVDKLIQRYTGIVMNRPEEPFPLQKLTELYRQRDGKLDALITEFEKRAAKKNAEQFNAKLALAGIYVHAGRKDDAARLLEEAIAKEPNRTAPRLMAARLAEGRSDLAAARKHYEAALPKMKPGVEKERVLRALMLLAIKQKDFSAAEGFHDQLVRAAGGSLFVKKEYANELFLRGHYVRAEKEYREIVKAATGDNRALAPALRDLGKALAKQKKMDEALKVLKRARRVAGSQAGIRREILFILTEVFREQGKLVELIAILEAEKGRDFNRLATIGALYEETGQVDKALDTYREALKLQRNNIDVRVKLVHLLQTAGQLDEAITEYEALIKAAPHNADFVFELAETLIQRGERDRALALVEDLEKRNASEGDILAAVADFYERIEEQDRAIKVFERLAKLPQGDPQYLIDLGDRYYQQGEVDKAKATWARIRSTVGNRARASSILGEVYLEHDLPDEALAAFREAVKLSPKRQRYKKQLAIALERTASTSRSTRSRYQEALQIWQDLLDGAGEDALLARECRTHIVSMWAIQRQLPSKVAPLQRKLDATPPDLQAGRLLAEVQRRLRKLKDAEKTLRKVVKAAPGDESSLLALERVLVMQRDLPKAIEVLKKLVEVNPKRARQYYQRMAQYAAELYRDDDAIEYAAKAVELSPNDAQGHYRLGEMYRRRQDTERAMVEFRKAISKNNRLFPAYFDLAELLLTAGKVEEADRLYRRVVRSSRDEAYVMRAARSSMQINLGRGSLESLERELLPVALGNPQRPVYRRLLVELYGAMTFPLVHAARLEQGEASAKARAELSKIGARAVKPLLDALADDVVSQQRIAIEVLAYVQNKGAGPALFNFATGSAERELRVRAMIGCGALDDPELLDRYEELLAPDDGRGVAPGDSVAIAAAWGVARMESSKARPLLQKLLATTSPELRGLAAIGLGLLDDPRDVERLADLARSPEAGPTARAAAAHAIGLTGDAKQLPLLLALTDAAEPRVRRAALVGIARLAGGTMPPDAAPVYARALFGDDATLRETALVAAAAAVAPPSAEPRLEVPGGVVAVDDVLATLVPRGHDRQAQARALHQLRPALVKAAVAAVATSPDRARVVAELVRSDLTGLLRAEGELPAEDAEALTATAEAVAAATVPGFVALARHPSVEVRKGALGFLARRDEAKAREAVVAALRDDADDVRKATLANLEGDHPDVLDAVVALLDQRHDWSLRAQAARALGRIGAKGEVATKAEAALTDAALTDPFAVVREAAARAAAERGSMRALLEKIAAADEEPRLREVARALLEDGEG